MALGGETYDEYLAPMLKYKRYGELIYQATGIQVTAFDMDDIPEDWLNAIMALEVETPRKLAILNRTKSGPTH